MAQRPGDFSVLGPGGGGAMYHPAISPTDPNIVLVACDMTGSYITQDGGRSWRMFNLRGVSREFVFDPVRSNVIYAVGVGLWRSEDTGRTWHMLWPAPRQIEDIGEGADHADVSLITKTHDGQQETFGPIMSVAVDQHDGRHLVAALGGSQPALWSSGDAGQTWHLLAKLESVVDHVYLHGSDVWAAGKGGFVRWDGGSIHRMSIPGVQGSMSEGSIDFSQTDHRRQALLIGVQDNGLYVAQADDSRNLHWRKAVLPGTEAHLTVAAGGHDGHTIYASYHDLKMDGKVWQGIAKSKDMGRHWSLIWKDTGQGAANFHDGWISKSHGSDWGGEPLTISVSARDANLVYATDLGRTMKSTDGGLHWEALYSHPASGGGVVSSGLDVLTSYGTFWDPFDRQRMFIAYTDIGLFRSENGGGSWISSSVGIPEKWRNTTYWLAFDPKVRGRIWAAASGTHDLPRPRIWRHVSPLSYHGGVCVSNDGGEHWTVAGSGLPEGAVTHILLDPKSPVGRRILYATVMGHGIYKSSDSGSTWKRASEGIVQPNPLTFRLVMAADGTLYALVVRRSEDGSIGNSGDGAMYRSKDGAVSWEPVALPAGVNAPNGLAIDPRNPSRLYLAAWARAVGQRGEGGGIYGSSDGGAHWSPLFLADQHIYDITWNPANPDELYAAGFESSAWWTKDRGQHWQRIAGYNFHWGHRVFVDEVHPGWIYINTFGGGVWHGRPDGQAAIEDIATESLAPGAGAQ